MVWFWIISASKGSRQQEMLKSRRVFLTGEVNDDMAKAVIVVGIPLVPYTKPSHCISHTITLKGNNIRNYSNLSPFLRYPTFLQPTRQRDKCSVTPRQRCFFVTMLKKTLMSLHMPWFSRSLYSSCFSLRQGYLDFFQRWRDPPFSWRGWSVWDTDWLVLICWYPLTASLEKGSRGYWSQPFWMLKSRYNREQPEEW